MAAPIIAAVLGSLAYYGFTAKQYHDKRKIYLARQEKKAGERKKKETEREVAIGTLKLMGATNVEKMIDDALEGKRPVRSWGNREQAKKGSILGNTKGR